MIETPRAVGSLSALAVASPRVESFVLGYADLAAALGRRNVSGRAWQRIQDEVLVAARSCGVQAIDGPVLTIAADDEFRAEVKSAVEFGFDGKWVIHPSQVDDVNRAFTADPADVEHAEGLLRALDDGVARGVGAVVYRGQMIDEAVAVWARRVLTRRPESKEERR